MSANPAQITPARIQAIVDDWLDILRGQHDPLEICGRFDDIVATEGTWTLDDSGLWLESGVGLTPVAALPIDYDSVTAGAAVRAFAALLYTSSTAAASQPSAAIVRANSSGVAVLGSSTTSAPATIGWHLVTWSGTASPASNDALLLRIIAASPGDRVAAALVALEIP